MFHDVRVAARPPDKGGGFRHQNLSSVVVLTFHPIRRVWGGTGAKVMTSVVLQDRTYAPVLNNMPSGTVVGMADLEQLPRRLSLWTAILTVVLAVVSLAIAVTTPPRSGPYCQGGCVGYPYTDAAAYVPRDYLWMYPAVVLNLLIVVLVECIQQWTPSNRVVLSRIGVAFAVLGASVLIVDYAGQLTFLQPALLLGETEGLSPWTQYNPHGVFIALENVGYLLLNVAFLFIGVAILGRPERLWRAAGWVFVSGGALTVAALVVYSALYRTRLDYRFEVAAIALTWLVLIVAPVLLSIALGRNRGVQGRRTAPVEMSSRS